MSAKWNTEWFLLIQERFELCPSLIMSLVFTRQHQVTQETLNSSRDGLVETLLYWDCFLPSPLCLSSRSCCAIMLRCSAALRGFTHCNELRGINTEAKERLEMRDRWRGSNRLHMLLTVSVYKTSEHNQLHILHTSYSQSNCSHCWSMKVYLCSLAI